MPTRLIIAYSLIALMIAALAALIAWKRHHGRERTYRRRLERERGA